VSFYPERVNDHFSNPRNVGDTSPRDAVGVAGSLVCGSVVRISLAVDAVSRVITDAKFKAAGCGYLIAAASVSTELVQGLKVGEAARLPLEYIEEHLGLLPVQKSHCAVLCLQALEAAAIDYRSHTIEAWAGEEALICTCFGVSETTIETFIVERALATVAEVTRTCNAGGGCGSCQPLIQEILDSRSIMGDTVL
jgi:NifU-like protein